MTGLTCYSNLMILDLSSPKMLLTSKWSKAIPQNVVIFATIALTPDTFASKHAYVNNKAFLNRNSDRIGLVKAVFDFTSILNRMFKHLIV